MLQGIALRRLPPPLTHEFTQHSAVVMGGVSESGLQLVAGAGEGGAPALVFRWALVAAFAQESRQAHWRCERSARTRPTRTHENMCRGIVSTDNRGGFASVRCRNWEPALDLGAYAGLRLRLKGNGLRCARVHSGSGIVCLACGPSSPPKALIGVPTPKTPQVQGHPAHGLGLGRHRLHAQLRHCRRRVADDRSAILGVCARVQVRVARRPVVAATAPVSRGSHVQGLATHTILLTAQGENAAWRRRQADRGLHGLLPAADAVKV